MNKAGNATLDRIQQEIQENLRREEELRKEYAKLSNDPTVVPTPSPTGTISNGHIEAERSKSPVNNGINNVHTSMITTVTTIKTNGFRRFAPNPSAKGMMQKFLKMRGKINTNNNTTNNNSNNNNNNNVIIRETNGLPNFTQSLVLPIDDFEPAKVRIETGKPIRNGYVSAEEKMRRELLDFQQREAELRKERRKSQPDLMAALEAETETNLKPARSMVQLYSTEDLTEETSSAPASLKPARSLADLLDTLDDELETPGTHSLIMQFENMNQQQPQDRV